MKAMVFAAGIGSRLKELTKETPKCLIDIGGGATMLGQVISRLKSAGVTSVIINLYHLSDKIERYLKENDFGVSIFFSKEEKLLGTGGGLKKAAWFFDDGMPFIVHNSDIYSDIDLRALLNYHRNLDAIATLAIMERPTSRHLVFDEHNTLIGWENKGVPPEVVRKASTQRKAAFSGIQVLNPRIFEYLKEHDGDFSIISAYLTAVKADEKLYGFDISSSFWIDMGTPEKLEELRKRVKG